MKVLLVADCVGGVFAYALELADALHAEGIEIVLAVMGGKAPPPLLAQLQRRPWLLAELRPFKLMWMQEPWADVDAAGRWLLELCERHQPDVVHLNDYAHAALPWPAPVLLVLHSCVTSWFAAVRGGEPPAAFARYRQVVREAALAADLVVAPTRAMLDAFERGNVACPRARVVHNGIDQQRLRPLAKGQYVLSVGRVWDEAKNLALLGRVAPQLPWPVLVAGATSNDGGGSAGVTGVRLLGELPRQQVWALLMRAPIYAHPAVYEPFGLAPLEAAAAGCALVLADIPSLRELWRDAAVLVPPHDGEALRLALQQLIEAPAQRVQLAQAARQRAAALTAARMATHYLDLYDELLRTKRVA